MEGMPRFPALIPDLKVPSNEYDDEFVYRLKEYILMHFQADPSNYDEAIAEIRKMKKEILKGHTDVEASCVLKRYYAQLLMMKNRFPMESGGECKTPFSWYERALDIPTAQSIADIGFEMACIMYQIGSVHAHIASEETRQDENSIKNAFMHFQYAAWPLQHIRDAMDVANFATSDFDKELLTFHVNVLLGQAQECLLEKSMLDHRGHAVVAKLAAYLRDLYSSCNRLLLNSNTAVEFVSSKKMKLWSRTCTIKSEIYGCIAMLYMGYKAEEDQKFGDRLGYCQAAELHLQKAIQVIEKEDRIEMRDTVQFVADVVKARLENAKKENDFIYHERIPKIDELLGSVEGLGKVHPLSFDPLDISVGGDDVFGALVPPTVLSAVSEYEEEKAKLKREVLKRVAERDEELQGFLGTLNATELGLHSAGPSFQLPEILLERNASMHSQIDAVPRLLEKLQKVDELARVADSKLTGMTTRLASIDLPEFTSDEGFRAISDEISRLQDHHNQARANNAELHKALAVHSTNIHLLSLPLHELTAKLSPTSDVPPASTKEGAALVRVLDKAHEMQTQRATLVQRLCDELEADDIGKKLLAERDVDNKATFAEELKKHDTTIKYIDANLTAQENILHHLTEANADFAEQRKVIQENNKARSEQVMTLVAACDIYTDICDKADDGKRFYDKLIDRMNKMSMAIEGIEAAYGQEKEKIEGEKRALEQKMAALRAAKEAREAMADFGGIPPLSGAGGMPKPSGVPQKVPRPRLGDYMDFYRNKMGARGMPPPAAPVMPQLPPMQPPSMHFPPAEVSPAGPPSPAPSSIADYHPDVHQEYVFPPQRMGAPYQPAGGYDPRFTPGGASPNPTQWNNTMPGHQQQQAHGYQSPYVPREMTPPHFQQQQQHQQPAVVNQATPLPSGANPAAPTLAPSHQPVPPQHFQPSSMPPPSSAYQPLGATRSSQTNVVSNQLPQNYQQQYHPGVSNTAMPPPSSQPAVNLPPQQFGSQPAVAAQSNYQQYGNHPAPQPPAGSSAYQQYSGQPTVTPQPPVQHQQQQFINQPPAVSNLHQYGNQPGVSPAPPHSTIQSVASRPPQPAVSNTHLSQHHFQPAVSSASSNQPSPAVNNGFPYSNMPTTSPVTPAVSNQQQYHPGVANAQPSFPQQQMPPSQPIHQNLNHGNQFVQPGTVTTVTRQPTTSFNPSEPPVSSAPSQPTQQQFQPPAAPATVSPAPWGAPRNNFGAAPPASPWHRPQTQSPWHQTGPPSSFNQPQQVGQAPAPLTPAQAPYQAPPTQQTSNMDLLSSLLGDLQLPAPIQPSSQTMVATTTFGGGQMETQTLQRAAAATSSEVVPAQTVPKTMTVVPSMSDSSMGNIRPAAAVLPMQQQKMTTAATETPILSMVNASSISVLPQVTSPKVTPPVQAASLTELADPEKFKIGDGDRSRLEKRQLHAAIRGNAPLPSLDPLDPLNQLDPFWSIKKT